MVDLKAIDTRIRKLQKLKEVLADEGLRELIADPELLELMKGAISTNGNGAGRSHRQELEIAENTVAELPAEGSLRRKVLDATRAVPGKFNTRDIVVKLEASGHQFDRDAAIAVNQVLRNLAKKKFVRLVRKGSGRIPHIYEAREVVGKN
ncbi:MAG: hypothetical protein WAM13_17555 [Candidatus Sulfotelmatobacter sp.]